TANRSQSLFPRCDAFNIAIVRRGSPARAVERFRPNAVATLPDAPTFRTPTPRYALPRRNSNESVFARSVLSIQFH
ncbi:hypothetical protein, partial [Burkholderia multivorans]|uniref:hypothetical protein n=1 Tax=Burkholderia multivorans TaxID=87883 RepID=UPI0021C1E4B1